MLRQLTVIGLWISMSFFLLQTFPITKNVFPFNKALIKVGAYICIRILAPTWSLKCDQNNQ